MLDSTYTQKKIISASLKILQIETFTYARSKVVSQVQQPQETKFPLPLNLRIAARQLNLQKKQWRSHSKQIKKRLEKFAFWVYLKRQSSGPKRNLTYFTVNKRSQLVGLMLDQPQSFFKFELAHWICATAGNNLFMILLERSTAIVFPVHFLSSLKKLIYMAEKNDVCKTDI